MHNTTLSPWKLYHWGNHCTILSLGKPESSEGLIFGSTELSSFALSTLSTGQVRKRDIAGRNKLRFAMDLGFGA